MLVSSLALTYHTHNVRQILLNVAAKSGTCVATRCKSAIERCTTPATRDGHVMHWRDCSRHLPWYKCKSSHPSRYSQTQMFGVWLGQIELAFRPSQSGRPRHWCHRLLNWAGFGRGRNWKSKSKKRTTRWPLSSWRYRRARRRHQMCLRGHWTRRAALDDQGQRKSGWR